MATPTSSSSATSVASRRAVLAAGDAMQRLFLAHGADPARHALPARLVAEERGDAQQRSREVDRVVEHHDDAGARASPAAARAPSNVSGMSSSSGRTKTPAAPPSRIAWSVRRRNAAGQLEHVRAAWSPNGTS